MSNFSFSAKAIHFTFKGHYDLKHFVNSYLFQRLGVFKNYLQFVSAVNEVGHGDEINKNEEGESLEPTGGDGQQGDLRGYAHCHVALYFTKNYQFFSASKFDVAVGDINIHPHIGKVSTQFHFSRIWHEYHVKQSSEEWSETIPFQQNYRAEYSDGKLVHEGGRECTFGPPKPSECATRNGKGKRKSAFECDGNPYKVAKESSSLQDACERLGIEIRSVSDVKLLRNEKAPPVPGRTIYEPDSFSLRIDADFRVVYLCGPSGIGKTQFALSCLPDALVVNDSDTLRNYDPNLYSGIIIDDMDFSGWAPEQFIALADWGLDRTIKARYSNAFIPRGTKKIIVSNTPIERAWRLDTCSYDQRVAILRRVYRLTIPVGFKLYRSGQSNSSFKATLQSERGTSEVVDPEYLSKSFSTGMDFVISEDSGPRSPESRNHRETGESDSGELDLSVFDDVDLS